MAATNSNQLWIPFSQEELEITKAHIRDADASTTFFLPLKDDDVKSYAKLDNNRENFIRDVISEMTNAKGTIPTLASLDKLKFYYANHGSAYDLEDIYVQAEKKARRNRLMNGGKAYDQASRFYFDLDVAKKDGIEGAEDAKKRLSKYFANQGGNNNDTPPAANNAPPK